MFQVSPTQPARLFQDPLLWYFLESLPQLLRVRFGILMLSMMAVWSSIVRTQHIVNAAAPPGMISWRNHWSRTSIYKHVPLSPLRLNHSCNNLPHWTSDNPLSPLRLNHDCDNLPLEISLLLPSSSGPTTTRLLLSVVTLACPRLRPLSCVSVFACVCSHAWEACLLCVSVGVCLLMFCCYDACEIKGEYM